MNELLAPIMPALGLAFSQETGFFYAATSNNVVRGQILDVDIAGDSAGSTGDNVGGQSDRMARAIEAQSASYKGGVPQIIAMESCRPGQVFKAQKRGILNILVSGEYVAGNVIIQNIGSTNGSRIRGFILASGGVAGSASYARCLFDGEVGFGTLVGASPPGGDPTYPVEEDVPLYDPSPENPADPNAPADETVPQGGVLVPVSVVID
jgi:hypothetical protein